MLFSPDPSTQISVQKSKFANSANGATIESVIGCYSCADLANLTLSRDRIQQMLNLTLADISEDVVPPGHVSRSELPLNTEAAANMGPQGFQRTQLDTAYSSFREAAADFFDGTVSTVTPARPCGLRYARGWLTCVCLLCI